MKPPKAASLAAALGALVALPLAAVPGSAEAHRYGYGWAPGPGYVYVPPPPAWAYVYVGLPVVDGPPPAPVRRWYWEPGHHDHWGRWVPGHWRRR